MIKQLLMALQKHFGNEKQWLTHLQEELMDATLYIEKLKNETN